METSKKAFLLLEDGSLFEGTAYGAIGTTTGEICFNTGMTGYQEVFTDPSYFGQILIMNTAHVGNYGTSEKDIESDSIKISGLVCKSLADKYSRVLANDSLESYLIKNKIVSIDEIDTRALVAHVRTKGAMNCIISSENLDIESLKKQLSEVPSMAGLEILDFGVKRNILTCMVERGAYLKVFPAKSSYEECEEFKPNAYFLSNGPGDPASMEYAVDLIKRILETNKPIFGICLGHQLLALANGATTYKMHHGHRGLNHPVLNLVTGKSEISTQNHGFAVDKSSVLSNSNIQITHINLNDETLEGIRIKDKNAFSVQYHPEATPGPHDSRYLFDEFIAMI